MKYILFIIWGLCFCQTGMAQQIEFKTFIYTSNDLGDEIARHSDKLNVARRGYLEDLFNASKESLKGIASNYVTSFIDLGINAIGSLVTRNARLKEEWEETVKSENMYEMRINTVSEINDFYKEASFQGAMDPKGMRFDGIGCLRMVDNDTVFYLSCHIDRKKIDRIVKHSKFELVLDTLIVSPIHSNLPNTYLDLPYSFAERDNFMLSMKLKLISSWMNEIVQLQKDQELGEFVLNVPVDSTDLDDNGFLRYIRSDDEDSVYDIVGESFIVPRSYMGFRDENDNYMNVWGTGEYKLEIILQETCDVTDQYRENWKKDRKRRKKLMEKKSFWENSWRIISNQRWDELAQSWIITTLQAPADIITKDVIEKLGLTPNESE